MAEQETHVEKLDGAVASTPASSATTVNAREEEQPPTPKSEKAEAAPAAEQPTGPGPPPDGGTKAWLQVVGGFLLVLNTWFVHCPSSYRDISLSSLNHSPLEPTVSSHFMDR